MNLWAISLLICLLVMRCHFTSQRVETLSPSNFYVGLYQTEFAMVVFVDSSDSLRKYVDSQISSATLDLQKSLHSVKLYVVFCDVSDQRICEKNDAHVFPAIKLYRNGVFWKNYGGSLKGHSLVKYMESLFLQSPTYVSSEEFLGEFARNESVYVGFFEKGLNFSLKRTFLDLAEETKGDIKMGICEEHEMMKNHCPGGGIVFVRSELMRSKFERDEIIYSGNHTKEDLMKWMKKVKYGLVGVRHRHNVNDFKEPLVVVYYDVDFTKNVVHTKYWRNRIMKIARCYKKYFNFAISSTVRFTNDFFRHGWSYAPSSRNLLVLAKTKHGKFSLKGKFSEDAFDNFLKKLKRNQLQPDVRTEDPPIGEKGLVKTVTGVTFDRMVANSGNDSFILFYSPNSPSVSEQLKMWSKVGKAMEFENVDILKLDVIKNEWPSQYEVLGFSTIYAVPSNSSNFKRFTDEYRIFNLIRFVAKHATDELRHFHRDGTRRSSMKNEL